MQIQLKQHEIIAALKQYVTSQGINLSDKNVKITFTAGRKDTGLSAEIIIDDSDDIPGFTNPTEPEEEVQKSTPVIVVDNTQPSALEASDVVETAAVVEETAPVAKTTSLFN